MNLPLQDQILSVDGSVGLDWLLLHRPTWEKAVNFSSFIHSTTSSVVLFCICNVIVRVVILTEDQVENLVSVE